MRFRFLALGFACLWLVPALASAGDDPRNYYKPSEEAVELDGVRIEFMEAWAEADFIHVKANIINQSNDFLFFKKHESMFEVPDKGEMAAHEGKAKPALIIDPKDSKKHTWKIEAESGLLVDAFELALGGFYRVSADGTTVDAEPFQLPAAKNKFEAGPFECGLIKKVYQETKETKASFECKYKGEAIGFLDPAALSVKIPEGQEFANDAKGMKKEMLKPTDSGKFDAIFHIEYRITDMQFTTMHIQWNGTFAESKMQKVDGEKVDFEFDADLTKEKND